MLNLCIVRSTLAKWILLVMRNTNRGNHNRTGNPASDATEQIRHPDAPRTDTKSSDAPRTIPKTSDAPRTCFIRCAARRLPGGDFPRGTTLLHYRLTILFSSQARPARCRRCHACLEHFTSSGLTLILPTRSGLAQGIPPPLAG